MSISPIDTAVLVPASVQVRLKRESNLAAMTEELVGLRFSIILLARWEAACNMDAVSLAALGRELAELRTLYMDKIDTLAMTFGVQQAMETKTTVERNVTVPRDMAPLGEQRQEQLYF